MSINTRRSNDYIVQHSRLYGDGYNLWYVNELLKSFYRTLIVADRYFLCDEEPERYVEKDFRERKIFACHHLAKELQARQMHRIDYMTIDTEGSEPDIVLDFPWQEFDVRVVQIEQLLESAFIAQAGKKEAIIRHMVANGYRHLSDFPVGGGETTQDLMFTRNLDSYLSMTGPSTKPSRIWPHEVAVA